MFTRLYYYNSDLELPLEVEFDFMPVGLGYATGPELLDEAEDSFGDLEITDVCLDEDMLMALFRRFGYAAEDEVREIYTFFARNKDAIIEDYNETDLKWDVRENWFEENDGI